MAVTIDQISDALESTLGAATGITTTQSDEDLAEGLAPADLPLLQVYWQSVTMDLQGETDRSTFGGGVRIKDYLFYVDLYAAQRAHLGQNFKTNIDAVDALIDVFEQQNLVAYFGQAGIRAWQLASATRATFEYTSGAGGAVWYVGTRFIVRVLVY